MAQISITGHVYSVQFSWEDKPTFEVHSSDSVGESSGAHITYAYVGPFTVPFTVPEGWSPQAAQVAALQAKRDAAAKVFADTVRAIDEQISKLTAIGCEVAA